MDLLRQYVGGPKNRYKDQKFNLDLTYISPRMIAMAFPASGVQKLYRNSVNTVKDFLTEHHGNNYLVINVSGRAIDLAILPNTLTFEWQDHQAPPLQMLFHICNKMSQYLLRSEANVVTVNCNHGKGRTGTIVTCFLLYCNLFKNAQIAIDFYAKKRFQIDQGYGVTQPCQIQYIQYFQKVLRNPNIRPQIIALTKVIFRGPTKYSDLYVKVKKFSGQTIVTTKKSQSKTSFQKIKNQNQKAEQVLTLSDQKFFFGDCIIFVKSTTTFSSSNVANYSFNTAFLKDNKHIAKFQKLSPYSLRKSDAFGQSFQIQLQFKYKCNCPLQVTYNERCELCKQIFKEQQQKWTNIEEIVAKRNAIQQTKREGMLGYHLKRETKNLRLMFGDKIDQYRVLKQDKELEDKMYQNKHKNLTSVEDSKVQQKQKEQKDKN